MTTPDQVPTRNLIHDGKDLILLLGLGVPLLLGVGAWCWAQVSALLSTARPAHVSILMSFDALGHLPAHLADPRAAWPVRARSGLPGAVLFYMCGVLLLAAGTTLIVAAARAWVRSRRRPNGMATRRQLRPLTEKNVVRRALTVRPSLAGTRPTLREVGVPLGASEPDRLPLAASVEDSVLVLAAPRQGKTSQVIIPWLHHWPGPALVTSLRTDVLYATANLRAKRGPVVVMAPTGMTSWPNLLAWSPTSGCQSIDIARKRAEVMVIVGKAEKQDSTNAGYFGANATTLLTLWLHAAALAGRPMTDVLAWSLNDRDDTPIKLLRDHHDAADGSAELLDGLYRTPPETRSGLWTTVQTALAPLLSPTAQQTFSPDPQDSFDIEAFLRSGGTIYLLVPKKQATALAPLITVFVDELIDTAKRLGDALPGGRLDPPLGMFLDEVANVVPLPSLPDLMSFAGGSGIFIVAVLQSRAQADARWGNEEASMLWGAATIKLILGGLSGNELRDISELAGDYDRVLISHQRHDDGAITTATNTQERKTLTPGQIRTLDPERHQALVIHATTPPVLTRMVRHYEGPDRHLYASAETFARDLITAAGNSATGHDTTRKAA
jgi:type IV secretion system protein VirD4